MVSSTLKANKAIKNSALNFSRSWLIWGCAALFYCYQFMIRVSPGVMAEDLMASFQVSACSLGMMVGFYYYMYSALQVPGGTLMDHFKPRRVLTIAAILCSIGTLLFATATSIYVAAFGRALIGGSSAMGFLSCLKLGTLWFPAHRLPLIIGLTVALGTIGGVSAGYPLGGLVELLGWRQALGLLAFVGLTIACLAWIIVRDTPPRALEEEIIKSHGDNGVHQPHEGLLTNIIEVIRKPQSWLIAAYGGLMYVPLAGYTDLWGPPFLMSVYNLDKMTAGAVNSALYVGLGLGSPLFPFLCNFIKAYKPTVFLSAFGSLVLLSAIFYGPTMPLWLLIITLFLAGVFLGGQFLAFSMTCALNPLSASATAGGFHNMVCMLSGVIFQPFIGWLLDLKWQGAYVNGVHVYTAPEYTFAFTSITLSLLVACLIIIPVKEKY